nr:hypothetical protein [Tanacetum cinerariifolium]
MAKIQEVIPYAANNYGPIFDAKTLQKVQNDEDNYNVFASDKEHPEQPKSVNNTYLNEQGDTNITTISVDMSTNGEEVDQDDDDHARELVFELTSVTRIVLSAHLNLHGGFSRLYNNQFTILNLISLTTLNVPQQDHNKLLPETKNIYKSTNNNLRTSSNTSRANQDNTPRTNRGTRFDNQRVVNVAGARETVDEPEDQELEANYLYMAKIQEVIPYAANNYGPIFDAETLQKVQNDEDNYNVFASDKEHPEQPKSVNDTYPNEQGDTNITTISVDMSTNGEEVDQDDDDLARERTLLASLIKKLKCKIDDIKNHNKLLESLNKTLVDKLKCKIKDFKNKNKCLKSSNNHFKEANNKLAKNNQLMFKDLKKFQAKLDRYHDVNYASKVEIKCEKAKG